MRMAEQVVRERGITSFPIRPKEIASGEGIDVNAKPAKSRP